MRTNLFKADPHEAEAEREAAEREQAERDATEQDDNAKRSDAERAERQRDDDAQAAEARRDDEARQAEERRDERAQQAEERRDREALQRQIQRDEKEIPARVEREPKLARHQEPSAQWVPGPGENPPRVSAELDGFIARQRPRVEGDNAVTYHKWSDISQAFTDHGDLIELEQQDDVESMRGAMKLAAEKYSKTGFYITCSKDSKAAYASLAHELGITHLYMNPGPQPHLQKLKGAERADQEPHPAPAPAAKTAYPGFDVDALEAMNEAPRQQQRERERTRERDHNELER